MAFIVGKITVEKSFFDQDFAEADIGVCKVGANDFYKPYISPDALLRYKHNIGRRESIVVMHAVPRLSNLSQKEKGSISLGYSIGETETISTYNHVPGI